MLKSSAKAEERVSISAIGKACSAIASLPEALRQGTESIAQDVCGLHAHPVASLARRIGLVHGGEETCMNRGKRRLSPRGLSYHTVEENTAFRNKIKIRRHRSRVAVAAQVLKIGR